MTDIQQSVHHTDHRPPPGPVVSSDAPHTNGHLTPVDGPTEDDSTIKCICGFNDDDGNTVLCEDCNTWQHIVCYYPGADVPEVHQCVNCKPRAIDAKAATERQKHTRFSSIAGERKQKRAPTKSHKKKNRDSVSAIQLNGTTNGDKNGHDRNSGSPLDVPPAKRPKTSHRTSSSTTSLTQQAQVNPTRRRTNSIAANRASPTKSPPNVNGFQRPNERFSLEFMQMYDKDYNETTTNSYNNLSTTVALSRWLDDSEEFEKVANGQTQHAVYMRWDDPWSELEKLSPGVEVQRYEDSTVTAHGRHPVFRFLTAGQNAGKGAFLGELTGQIAIKQDYEASSKMWPILRHPEPFVFFSDKLPICIDARNEGNKFRFIRRSCTPNSKMQIVIAGKSYRFCLVTEAIIMADEEITLPWYIDPKIMDILRASVDQRPISPEEHDYRVKWISGILAHFGRCACNRPDDQCLLSLARTPRFQAQDVNGQGAKAARKKGKKHVSQISPSSTGHATNSRAGSEAVNQFDIAAEAADSPASASGPSKSSSRDISPAVAEAGIGLGVDLSEREKRKIQEQERLFARLEQDDSRRRKRNSAGSTLNTPTIPNAVSVSSLLARSGSSSDNVAQQSSHPADAISPSPMTPAPPKSRANGRSQTESKQREGHGTKSKDNKPFINSKREYFESATQTDEGPEQNKADKLLMQQRRAVGCSYAQRLLLRSRKLKGKSGSLRGSASPASVRQSRSPALALSELSLTKMELDSPTKQMSNNQMLPPPIPAHAIKDNKPALSEIDKQDEGIADIEMADAAGPSSATSNQAEIVQAAPTIEKVVTQSTSIKRQDITPVQEPKDSLMSNDSTVMPTASVSGTEPAGPLPPTSQETPAAVSKPLLSVKLPPHDSALSAAPVASMSTPTEAAADVVSNINGNTILEPPETPTVEKSPTMLKAVLSSSLTSGANEPVAPSPPPRKKMSLSDWSSRNKKKKIEAAQQAAQNSPLINNTSQPANEDVLMQSPEEEKKPELVAGDSKDSTSTNGTSSNTAATVSELAFASAPVTTQPMDTVTAPGESKVEQVVEASTADDQNKQSAAEQSSSTTTAAITDAAV